MPFTRIAFKKAFKGIQKRATGFILLAFLFLIVGLIQHRYVSYQIRKTTKAELRASADQIAAEIYKNDKWDLIGYRQAFFSASTWYILSANGWLIDNEAPTSGLLGLFRSVEYPTNLVFGRLQTIKSDADGQYRILAKHITNGIVIVGRDIEDNVGDSCADCIDQRLAINLGEFGTTMDSATAVTSRAIDEEISYAVISADGELKSGLGEIPLKVDASALLAATKSNQLHFDGQTFVLISRPIIDSKNKIIGMVVVPSDITFQQQAVNEQLKFNLALAVLAFAVAVLISIYFIGREISRRPHFEQLPEALNSDENLHKEFKSSFQWDINQNQQNPGERLKTFKTVVAFLNSEGGVLFIGINNDRTVRGLQPDLALFNGSADRFQLQIADLISAKIGSGFSPLIRVRCEEQQGQTVCVIEVEESSEPAFLRDDGATRFYIRENNRTRELGPAEMLAYFRSRRRTG